MPPNAEIALVLKGFDALKQRVRANGVSLPFRSCNPVSVPAQSPAWTGIEAVPNCGGRADQSCQDAIVPLWPPIRSTLVRTISRCSPGARNGYVSVPRNLFASVSMCSSAPASLIVAFP